MSINSIGFTLFVFKTIDSDVNAGIGLDNTLRHVEIWERTGNLISDSLNKRPLIESLLELLH